MPQIKVVYWNIENFGDGHNGRRGNYVPLCNFIAKVIQNIDADILCIMELRQSGIAGPLNQLQTSLSNAYAAAGALTCDWYCDWIPGALRSGGGGVFNPNNLGFTGQARNEGYAVLWKQNIDKFIMQPADPIDTVSANPPGRPIPAPGSIINTQSHGTLGRGAAGYGILPANINFLPAGGGGQFLLPAGTTPGGHGIIRGAAPALPAGVAVGVPLPLDAGDIIPAGTVIGQAGLQINAGAAGNPIVIPGGYTMSSNFTLPSADIAVPQHALNLVLTRRISLAGNAVNYNPGGANNWELNDFPTTAGAMLWNGARRPAYCTIKLNLPLVPNNADKLIPITFYHTPVANPNIAMQHCAISRQLYEAYDHTLPALGAGYQPGRFIHNRRCMAGGDLNARLDAMALHYGIFSQAFAAGGANCQNGGVPNIRVNDPAPVGIPAFPPLQAGALAPSPADNPSNKSTIQLRHPVIGGNQTLSANFDHYRRLAIDNILYRGFVPNEAPNHAFRFTPMGGAQLQVSGNLYDLVRAVTGNVTPPGAAVAALPAMLPDNFFIPPPIINAFAGLPVFLMAFFLGGVGGPLPIGLNSVIAPIQLHADIVSGVFQTPPGGDPPVPVTVPPAPFSGPPVLPVTVTPQRRASEFIKLFVSDHLPVIFTINL